MFLDPATSDQVEIDATGMSPCILAPPQCTSGATYMFWVKLLDTKSDAILTTMDWSSPTEGIKLSLNSHGSFYAHVFREGLNLNNFRSDANDFHSNLNTRQHITVVWKIDPKFEVFVDGVVVPVSQGNNYSTTM